MDGLRDESIVVNLIQAGAPKVGCVLHHSDGSTASTCTVCTHEACRSSSGYCFSLSGPRTCRPRSLDILSSTCSLGKHKPLLSGTKLSCKWGCGCVSCMFYTCMYTCTHAKANFPRKKAGHSVATFDKDFEHRNIRVMDFLSPAGYALPA